MNTSENAAMDFSYLDSLALREKYASGPSGNHISFYIDGIRCGSCVRRLEQMAGRVPGIVDLRVNLPKKIASAEVDLRHTTFAAVAQAVRALGFEPVPLTCETEAAELAQREDRRELIRLAVAGACAGNIMSFAFATYFGAAAEWAALFGWLSFFLYLPVVTFVAWPFYRGAWSSLRQGRLSIDLPMAVASLSGFSYSTYELARGGTNLYFDSLSGFLFLILASRYFQRRLQRRFLEPANIMESLRFQRVRRLQGPSWQWQDLDKVAAGERIVVMNGETVPADCDLLDGAAHFSLAYLSGENAARKFAIGSNVPAGARLIGGESRMIVRRTIRETAFGRLLAETRRYSLSHVRQVEISDRWAQWLIATVFTVGALFLVLHWPHSPSEAVRRSLALIILACPCAMAFGTPLAVAAAIRKCHRKGILVRDGGVFERVTQIQTVFFDKTGTLTDADLSLEGDARETPRARRRIILALEQRSHHPIAFAFRKAFHEPGPLLSVHEFREIPGEGVEGFVGGRHYRLIKPVNAQDGHLACVLEAGGKEIQRFHFSARLKSGAESTIHRLKKSGLKVRLLSGDHSLSAHATGRAAGFQEDEIFGAMTPHQKRALVEKTPFAMMIGDGINDAPALMAAHVGVAATGGVEGALRSSQVLLTAPSVQAAFDLFKISRSAFASIRRNLITSAVYNAAAGTLALLGYINPYVAALLMPASSGMLLLTTWLGDRE